MRLVALVCFVSVAGCQGGKFSRYSAVAPAAGAPCEPGAVVPGGPVGGVPPGAGVPVPGGPGAHAGPGQPCGPNGYPPGYGHGHGHGYAHGPGPYPPGTGPCPTPCPPQVKSPPPTREVRAPGPTEEVTETRQASAIAPDILLIPKTVLMPYQPYVPTGPVRLQGATPAARVVTTEERVTRPAVELPGPPVAAPPANDALDQLLQQLRLLNGRIADLEARATTVVVPCPPARVPCPPAGPCRPGHPVPYAPAVPYGPGYPVPVPPPGVPLPPRLPETSSVPMVPPAP